MTVTSTEAKSTEAETTQQEAKGIKKKQEAKSSGETRLTEVQATLMEAFVDLNGICTGFVRLLKGSLKLGLELFSLMRPVPAVKTNDSIHNVITISLTCHDLWDHWMLLRNTSMILSNSFMLY